MPQPKDKTKVKEWKAKISKSLQGRRSCMRTEFGRGHIPWNKGTKGLTKRNKTSFKKGNKPSNYMGGYKVGKDGIYVRVGTKTYKYANVEVGKYEQLARIKYRKAFGNFDKKLIIFHKDGDKMNNEIDNLELISRKELLKRNGYKNKCICKICGKEFLGRVKKCYTCSKKCRKEYGKILNAKWILNNWEKNLEYKRKYKLKKKGLLIHTTTPKSL